MGADAPTPGDWFVIANAVTGLRAPEPDGVHRLIVKSAWPGPRATLLPRSASWGQSHKAHQGSCGSDTCRIDRDGEIGRDVRSVHMSELSDYSCMEPDEMVVEWVMSVESDSARKRGRR